MTWYGIVQHGLIPFIVKARCFGEAGQAMLLSAFSLGYVPVQIPASLLARHVGEKIVITANLLVNGVLALAMPRVASAGALPLAACLATMGVFQGCRVPCNAAINARWKPDGVERIWTDMIAGYILTSVLTANMWAVPRLAGNYGWTIMPRAYGVMSFSMALIWHVFAANTPDDWRFGMSLSERQLLESIGKQQKHEEKCVAVVELSKVVQEGPFNDSMRGTSTPPEKPDPLSLGQLLSIPVGNDAPLPVPMAVTPR
eukprot:SAG31_NODE_9854_length_1220_cov_1.479037_1_plen_257_part_00